MTDCNKGNALCGSRISTEYIDDLVEKICQTYSDGNGVNHSEGNNLPRESEILAILRDLFEIVFPGFGEREPQSLNNLRYSVGEIVSRCYHELRDVIFRSFRYNCDIFTKPGCDCQREAEEAALYLLSSLPEIRVRMKLDIQAAFDGDPAAKTLDEIVLSYPGVKAITIQRIAHRLYEKKVPLIPRMLGEYAHRITGIDIHPGARLGRGIFIDHGTGVDNRGQCDDLRRRHDSGRGNGRARCDHRRQCLDYGQCGAGHEDFHLSASTYDLKAESEKYRFLLGPAPRSDETGNARFRGSGSGEIHPREEK